MPASRVTFLEAESAVRMAASAFAHQSEGTPQRHRLSETGQFTLLERALVLNEL